MKWGKGGRAGLASHSPGASRLQQGGSWDTGVRVPLSPAEETPFEVGVRVQIHSQEEPPTIDQLGFGAAPGYQTFVSCQQQRVSSRVFPTPSFSRNISDHPRGLQPSACCLGDHSHCTWSPHFSPKPP